MGRSIGMVYKDEVLSFPAENKQTANQSIQPQAKVVQQPATKQSEVKQFAAKPAAKTVTIKVNSGESIQQIGLRLRKNNIIKDEQAFVKRLKELKLTQEIRIGTYALKTNSNLDHVIKTLVRQ
ncbi:hypothetical protein RDV78_03405 [Bacillota bacterium LX-D]|nr:hypothetical protein [Bacillota bacterium LX-D]